MKNNLMKISFVVFTVLFLLASKSFASDTDLLSFPNSYVRLSNEQLSDPSFNRIIQHTLPGTEAVWAQVKDDQIGVQTLVGYQPIQGNVIKNMTRQDFTNLIGREVGQGYVNMYKGYRDGRAVYEIKENGPIILLKVSATYNDQGYPYTNERYILFYNLNNRMDVVFSGRTVDYAPEASRVESIVDSLIEKLARRYPEGIRFATR